MAKAAKTAEASDKDTKAKRAPPPRKSVEFGVSALAKTEQLKGRDASDIRVLLRSDNKFAEEYKGENGWDFGNQRTVDKIAKELAGIAKERATRAPVVTGGKKADAKAEAAKKADAKAEEAEAAKKAAKASKKAAAAAK